MKFSNVITLFLMLCCLPIANAQDSPNEYAVLFTQGAEVFPENIQTYLQEGVIAETDELDGQCFFFLQFYETPNARTRDELSQQGIELLQYIPHHTYVAAVATDLDPARLEEAGVRSLVPIRPEQKLIGNLQHGVIGPWTRRQGSQIEVLVTFYELLDYETIARYLEADGFSVSGGNGISSLIRIMLDEDRLNELAALSYVSTIEEMPPPGVPEDIPGRSLHRACAIDTDYPSGRTYTGEGVGVLVRDDGFVGPHIDFQGRNTQSTFYDSPGAHAEGVAGILAGAGNLNPANRGMAAGSDMYVLNYNADFTDNTLGLHIDNGVLVTNSSYSNGCNAGYTSITRTVDQQCFDFPTLLHVFSAGNSNNNNCGYGAGNQWGNITGGHKQGKNVIATANLFADAELVNSSSRGPAHDGRIKPDIAANGQNQISTDPHHQYAPFGGTSGASPGIAGITAQLHQAYQEFNNGEVASGAFLKAVLMNTANDLGPVGPDFRYGWGHVNAYRAALVVEEERYFSGSVDQGDTVEHLIEIPAGIARAKIMTYWADPEASPMVTKALINDIDTRLLDPSAGEHLPWVLDETPNPATLGNPATKGADHLNNVEQVEILDPAAGEYTLEVSGFDVPMGPAEYYVIIEFETNDIALTYPVGGEGMQPNEVHRLHWDAVGEFAPFTLEYSTDGGSSWNMIGTADEDERMLDWVVPSTVTGQAHVRITRDGSVSMNETPFSIIRIPGNVEVVQACPDYIRLSWTGVAGADGYDVFRLGAKYMDSIGTTTDLFYDIPVEDPNDRHWVSVRAKGDDGRRSRRANAILYYEGLKDCPLDNDLELASIVSPQFGSYTGCAPYQGPVEIELYNGGQNPVTDPQVSLQVNNGTLITETVSATIAPGDSYVYTFNEELAIASTGTFPLEVWLHDNQDDAVFNDSLDLQLSAFIQSGSGLTTIFEDFEDANNLQFVLENQDNDLTWEPRNVTGASGNNTGAIMVENYYYPAQGEVDALSFYPIDLTDAGPNTGLSFEYAYAPLDSASQDEFRVDVFTECGNTFVGSPFDKKGFELATTFQNSSPFFPQDNDHWSKEGFSLEPYAGQSVVLRFVSTSQGGNNLFLDNINVKEFAPAQAAFSASKLEICVGASVIFLDNSSGDDISYSWSFGEGSSPSSASGDGPYITNYSEPGTKQVQLIVSNPIGSDTSIVEIIVYDDPVANFTTDITNGIVAFTETSAFGQEYLWDFGDGNTSSEPNPTHIYDESGTYTVSLTVSNPCGDNVITQDVTVVASRVNNQDEWSEVTIAPNPNDGHFVLEHSEIPGLNTLIQMYDLSGKLVYDRNWPERQQRVEMHLPELAAGIYYLRIASSGKITTRKIVIE